MNIRDYGWNEFFEQELRDRGLDKGSDILYPARVVADYGQMLRVVSGMGELLVQRPLKKQENEMQIAVGDWVGLKLELDAQSAAISFVFKRKTKFSRAASGLELKEQIVAANVDTVFLVQSLNRDFNMKRLERYLVSAWESGATPVVVLTKSDCCEDVASKIAIAGSTAPGVDIYAISCMTGEGLNDIRKYLKPGKTVALLGSSGVGKSTLVNTLVGTELLKTQEIREDDCRGRHTTTHRELVLLPGGGLILDTPGMRSLSLWESDSGMEILFGDIEEMVASCRFNDCSHGNEPGCAIRDALETGKLEIKRWESWLKLQKELKHLEAKKEGKLRLQEKQWGRQLSKMQKEIYKQRFQ